MKGVQNASSSYRDDLVERLPAHDRRAATKAAAAVMSKEQAKLTDRQAAILLRLFAPIADNPEAVADDLWIDEDQLRDVDRVLMMVGRLVNRRLAYKRQDETSGRKAYRLTATGILLARKLTREAAL